MRTRFLLFLFAMAIAPAGAPLGGQVRPDLTWRTLHTHHFRVHYNPGLERLAERTAANAEWAYAALAEELVAPRGVVDIVLADNVDYANGYATPYPSNRIVVYARPPVETMSLRNHVDWNLVLVTHELAHIFHLDRSRGWWRVAQRVFGRAAPLFPNTYAPSWMVEGLAVHYETRLTQGGRLAGTEFAAFARAAALGDRVPSLHELSLSTPRFPGGDIAYIYGAYAMSRAEPGAVARFVEASSARLIPWHFSPSAKAAFGESFESYWERWRDSVVTSVEPSRTTTVGQQPTRVLTTHGFEARFPRWLDDTTLIYVASDARVSTGVYRLRDSESDPRRERIGRRNTIDVNTPAGGRRIIQAELEWADPYTLRSDLYASGGGLFGRKRLTRNERLSSPDLHQESGKIVAVQTDDGTTRLVVLDGRGEGTIRRLVEGSADRTWSEPRWSHDGTRVVAARWERGGTTSIVVLDARGQEVRAFTPRARRLSIVSSPVFMPGDTSVLFVSDHEGRAMIYRGELSTGAYARVWGTATALNTPDISPDGRRIAAVELGAKGYQVVTQATPAAGASAEPTDSAAVDSMAVRRREFMGTLLPPDTGAYDTRYSALEHLRPTWWLPSIEQDDAGTTKYGFLTGARDVVGRHDWEGTLEYETSRQEWHGTGAYRWSGLGNPTFTVYGLQEWLHGEVQDQTGAVFGLIGQRERAGGVSVLFDRPRVRLSTYAIVGAEWQQFDYRTYPSWLIDTLTNRGYREVITNESVEGTLGFSTMQRPGLAVSVQDGIAASFTQRRRFGSGVQFEDVDESIVTMSAAKSIPMPGYARHVLALRGAYGEAGHASTNAFGVGGVSGTSIELVPGITYGGSRRTFFVRGFEGNAQLGVRAAAASLEYRAPLLLGGRGVPFLPVFFQKSSLTAFADAGSAWCSFPVPDSFICPAPRAQTWLGSVGGELALDAALQYDTIYRFRLGLAHPVYGEEFAERKTTIYFSLGSTF
jgi:hypothetical protein